MIIALTSQKGGVGKSTIATNIAAAMALAGKDVLLVDADRQATCASWSAERTELWPDRPMIHAVQKYDDIKATLRDLAKRYEVVVVDCAGRDSQEMRTALLAADIAIIPIRCSQPDLNTLQVMNARVEQSRDVNEKLRAYVLLSIVPTNPVIREEDEARSILSDFQELVLLKSRVCDRKVYRDAMSNGTGVLELENSKGKDEILDIIKEIGLGLEKSPQRPKAKAASNRGGDLSHP